MKEGNVTGKDKSNKIVLRTGPPRDPVNPDQVEAHQEKTGEETRGPTVHDLTDPILPVTEMTSDHPAINVF
jgi:hypothetical protein